MADIDPESPAAYNRIADGDPAMPMDKTAPPRYDQPPLPSLPLHSGPAGHETSSHSASDTSGLQRMVDEVLQSDIGVTTLLNRLKQSIASARDLSAFLKERSNLEERHANGLKKLCRATHEVIRRPDSRHGSFAQSYGELTTIQDQVADHGLQFAMSLHQMCSDLNEVGANVERGRKHWKHKGLDSEQRYQDAESAAGKAKTKYDMFAEQYDRARTGDRQSGRFNLKTKSAAQLEEDLNRKVQTADAEYAARVQAAQASKRELITSLRPQATRAMTELITECDSAVALQLQKFTSLNERLLLGNGLCISPLKTQPNGLTSEARSQREVINTIDDEKDLQDYLLSFSNQSTSRNLETKYEKHPSLQSFRQPQPPFQQAQQSFNSPANAPPSQHQGPQGVPGSFEKGHHPSLSGSTFGVNSHPTQPRDGSPLYTHQSHYPSGSVSSSHGPPPQHFGAQIPQMAPHSPINMANTNTERTGEVPLESSPSIAGSDRMGSSFQGPTSHSRSMSQTQQPYGSQQLHNQSSFVSGSNIGSHQKHNEGPSADLPPLNPVFGMPLDELFRRDGSAVPSIVQQCTFAVEMFGLNTEGIYRTSGSTPIMLELKAMFDHDSSQIDLRNPPVFHHEISTVTTLLKHFLRALPDPLLSSTNYVSLVTAAQIQDDITRRDSLHAIINELPDPNYATLRHLTLHLQRVAQHAPRNRMTAGNLAIVFGPTLMGQGSQLQMMSGAGAGADTGDLMRDEAGLQAQVVETIILSTFQIFDEDE